MGFKDLKSFNLALLAKQPWRMITETRVSHEQNLQVKILFSYPLHLLDGRVRSDAFFLQKSMLQGLKIFKMGLRWRVGDRAHIKIWHDQLIPRSVNFKPLLYLLNLRVANLILMNHRRWNTSPPHSTLGSIYVHEIKRILLCAIKNNDALIWHYTPLGEFTVFSAYKKR